MYSRPAPAFFCLLSLFDFLSCHFHLRCFLCFLFHTSVLIPPPPGSEGPSLGTRLCVNWPQRLLTLQHKSDGPSQRCFQPVARFCLCLGALVRGVMDPFPLCSAGGARHSQCLVVVVGGLRDSAAGRQTALGESNRAIEGAEWPGRARRRAESSPRSVRRAIMGKISSRGVVSPNACFFFF